MATSDQPSIIPVLQPRLITGSSIISYRPLISPNERWLLCICGRQVRIFSIADGKLQSVLQSKESVENGNNLVGIAFNPKNPHTQIYTASNSGVVNLWDYEDGVLVKTYQIPCRIFGLYLPYRDRGIFTLEETKDNRNIVASGPGIKLYNHSKDVTSFSLVNIQSLDKTSLKKKPRYLIRLLSSDPKKVAFHKGMNFVAAVNGNALRICFFNNDRFLKHIIPGRELVSLAIHPTDNCIATGEDSGRIILWHGFEDYKQTIKSILHWHWSPVADLAFSNEGSYLWSGGLEVTLVQWSLVLTNHTDFLPRLGAPINHITVSSQDGMVALSLDDGVIQFVSPQRTLLGSVKSLHLPAALKQHSSILTFDPTTSSLVLNGQPGSLQFYHPLDDRITKNLEVVTQNIIGCKNMSSSNSDVTAAAFSPDGLWLCTSESIQYEHLGTNCILKFWTLDSETNLLSVRSSVFDPHEQACVKFILFAPKNAGSKNVAISLGQSDFKLWMEFAEKTLKGSRAVFYCIGQGSFRDCQPTTAAFSQDANLVAVGFNHMVTFWHVDSTQMKDEVLMGRKHEGALKHISFATCKLVVTASERSWQIWDLDMWTELKSVDKTNFVLIKSPFSIVYATLQSQSVSLWQFGKEDLALSFSLPNVNIVNAVFASKCDAANSSEWDCLYFITDCGEIWTIDEKNSALPNAQKLAIFNEKPSLLAQFLASSISILPNQERQEEKTQLRSKKNDFIQRLLDAPVHTMATPRYFLAEHLDSLLYRGTSEQKEESMNVDTEPEPEVRNLQIDSDDEESGVFKKNQQQNGSSSFEDADTFVTEEPIDFEFLTKVGSLPEGDSFDVATAICCRMRNLVT